MNSELVQSPGPLPFRFSASRTPMEGAAFSLPFKLLAGVIVIGAAAWLTQIWLGGLLGAAARQGGGWFALGLLLMAYTWWHILRSRTRIEAASLRQSWLLDKQMDLRELAYAKLIRVRGLDWLIAPRLYVRTLMGKFAVFYAADPALIAEFERLVKELAEFRRSER